jgi:hypothetical protein
VRAGRAVGEANLDSLLDTMANVVGILVVLVAVTQLSVTDAVERIRDSSTNEVVELAFVEETLAEQKRIEEAVVVANGELAAMAPTARRAGMLLEEAEPLLDQLEALPGRDRLDGPGAEKLRSRLEREAKQIERLEETVVAGRSQLLRLDEVLSEVPTETRPKIARLPDPRPPPEGAREVGFFCRYGRVQFIDVENMKARLYQGIEDALGDDRAIEWSDRPWLRNLFLKEAFGDPNFVWSFRDQDSRSFFADIHWRDERAGEGLAELRSGATGLREVLAKQSPSGHYLRFYVWPDSFETYLEARYIAEAEGFDVSWLAVDEENEVGIDLMGGRQQRVLID